MIKKEQVFVDNPNMDVAYKTSDGKYFFTEGIAKSQASTLKNKKITKLVNSVKSEDEEFKLKFEELENLELVPQNYNEIKKIVSFLGIETKGNKAEDLILALEKYKKDLE